MKRSFVILISLFLSSCSVVPHMRFGNKTPDLSAVRIGATYDDVKSTLGRHKKVEITPDGKRLYVYKYEKEWRHGFFSALGHMTMYGATLGTWELIAPEDRYTANMYITYDDNRKVDSMNKYIIQ